MRDWPGKLTDEIIWIPARSVMYVNNPDDLAQLPEIKREVEFEEPRDYHEFFHDDVPLDSGRYVSYHQGIHSQVCRFDEKGNHTSMADNCPHFEVKDEEGKRIIPGWTVQQR